jgi:hypothetical protein
MLDSNTEENTIDSRRDISAWALTMSLSCVTDKEKSGLDAGLERDTHSERLEPDGWRRDKKSRAARREAIFR